MGRREDLIGGRTVDAENGDGGVLLLGKTLDRLPLLLRGSPLRGACQTTDRRLFRVGSDGDQPSIGPALWITPAERCSSDLRWEACFVERVGDFDRVVLMTVPIGVPDHVFGIIATTPCPAKKQGGGHAKAQHTGDYGIAY